MSELKKYREVMKNMSRKQLNEQYSEARERLLSIDNSLKMISALLQFELSIMYLKDLDWEV